MLQDYIFTLKDVLTKREINKDIGLNDEQRKSLLEECEISDINYFNTNIRLYPISNNKGIGLEANIKAHITQSCVITLSPIDQTINENICLRFVPKDSPEDDNVENNQVFLNKNLDYFDTDILHDDKIDVFDLVREHFILAINPLPRLDDAVFKGYTSGKLSPDERKSLDKNLCLVSEGKDPIHTSNPFSILEDLKKSI